MYASGWKWLFPFPPPVGPGSLWIMVSSQFIRWSLMVDAYLRCDAVAIKVIQMTFAATVTITTKDAGLETGH